MIARPDPALPLRTTDALTGALLWEFSYDPNGLLVTVTDGDSNITSIERDAEGNPLAIVAPRGQRTNLALTADGFLSSITNPKNEAFSFAEKGDGNIF